MPGARDHLDQPARDLARSRKPDDATDRDPRPSITASADPRLAVPSAGTHADLMRVQRSAGNAAVASLVAPAVQRAIILNEVTSQVTAPPEPTGGEGAAAASSPEASAAPEADHTINAAHIGLNAPMVEASGVIRAQTVMADTIIASTYTPGAGNVM